jgi:hypothetical protein
MPKMFDFNGADYADVFCKRGYVHVPQGLSQDFHDQLVHYVHTTLSKSHLKEFALGDKQQLSIPEVSEVLSP